MKMKKLLKDIASYSKGTQINGDELIEDGEYDYLNGGVVPSGKWNEYNTPAWTVTISEGGNSCGFVNYMKKPFWCGAHCYYLYDTLQNSQYLYYVLKSQQRRLMGIRTGACMPNIKKTDLGNFEVVYDSDEKKQEYVVSVLRKIESIISAREQEHDKLDDLIKARFVEMFGDPIANPMRWDKCPLGKECEIITGNTPSRKVSAYYGDYIEWIKSDNINTRNAILTKAEEYLSEEGLKVGRCVDAGAILMTCIAGSLGCIGNVAIADRQVSFNQQINGIIPRKNNTWFMYVLFELSKKVIQSSINMALKGILSKGQLAEMEFIFPPIDLQNEFADFVEQVEKSKAAVQKSLTETQLLFDSLMQQYFG